MQPLIITCAITGAETLKSQNPNLPITVKEQVQATIDAYNAGATVVHLHVRDDSGAPTQDSNRFQEVIDGIRAKCPIVIQISTGGAVGDSIADRARPLDLKPEMASLNVGSINFGDDVFINKAADVELLATKMLQLKIKPEIEVYDLGMMEVAKRMMKSSLLASPTHFNFVLGTSHGLSGDMRNIGLLIDRLPSNATFTATGIGRYQLPVATYSLLSGGHVRVGLEDNIYFAKGQLATSNAQLVERVASLAHTLQRPIASIEATKKWINN